MRQTLGDQITHKVSIGDITKEKTREEHACACSRADEVGSSLSSFSLASLEEEDRPPSAKTPEEEPAFSRYLKNEQTTAEGENGLTPEKEKNFFPSHQTEERRSLSEAETTGDVLAGNPITNISGSGAVGRNGSGRKLKRSRRKKPPTEAEVIAYCVEIGRTAIDGKDRYLDFRAKGFPPDDWRAVIDRYNLRGWLPSQKDGAQTEEESPEVVQRQKEANEKDRQQRQEDDRRRKEDERRRGEEIQREYEQTRNDGESLLQWSVRRGMEAEEERKKELELRRQKAEAEIEAKKKKELEERRKYLKKCERILEEDRRRWAERHREYLRTQKDGETFGEWSLRMIEMKKRTNEKEFQAEGVQI